MDAGSSKSKGTMTERTLTFPILQSSRFNAQV
jgi:hypothetical protein